MCVAANLCTLCFYYISVCSEVIAQCSREAEVNRSQGVIPSSSALFHQQDRVGSTLH